jgi:SAM-dependent methyltransferase
MVEDDASLRPPDEVLEHNADGYEAGRLFSGRGILERIRTEQLLLAALPPSPARIVDVGGGPGHYAAFLAERGYEVHLVDPVGIHVERAGDLAGRRGLPVTVEAGDARRIELPDASADAVLLLGPLYHLTERRDRLLALREASRILRPGGLVVAAAISRFASLYDGYTMGLADDPAFRDIVDRDLAEGQHRNLGNHPSYFTTAFFHRPEDLREELEEAGDIVERIVAVEGPFAFLPDLAARWSDGPMRQHILRSIEAIEREPSLLGATAHLLAVARRP